MSTSIENNPKEKVLIFCVDHRPEGWDNPAGLATIGVGKCRRPGILYDNEGENISELNPHLNEATAIYWIWKHPEVRQSEYVGFCHYRRFLEFHPVRNRRAYAASGLWFKYLHVSNEKALAKACIKPKDAEKLLKKRPIDGILSVGWAWTIDLPLMSRMIRSKSATEKWIHRLVELLKINGENAYAQFAEEALLNRADVAFCNTFLVKSELFDRMCKALYPSLIRLTEEWLQDPSEKEIPREPGYLSEYFTGMYWIWLEETGQAKFLRAQILQLSDKGHGLWYADFKRFVYRFFPDWLINVLFIRGRKKW